MDWDHLYEEARGARERAYAPYSRFQVGAALLTVDGTVFTGCNVENRSFGLCICAERTAVARAVEAGHREFQALAVVTDCTPVAVPCGMCRETLAEFAGELPVLCANLDGERVFHDLSKLHPARFEWPDNLPIQPE